MNKIAVLNAIGELLEEKYHQEVVGNPFVSITPELAEHLIELLEESIDNG